MTLQTTIDRHPEVAASSAALEGRRPDFVILRGSQALAPQDDENNHRRHCEERKRRSNPFSPFARWDGLLRCARNDGKAN
jgi:hypothetical protein